MSGFNLPIEVAEPRTGMAHAVLSELSDHLPALVDEGKQHVIDLTSLPMTETDKRELQDLLGKGEVSITLSTIGDSQIFETKINGIWWIKHYGADGQLISELIEITRVPDIIKSHSEEIRISIDEIHKLLKSNETGEQV